MTEREHLEAIVKENGTCGHDYNCSKCTIEHSKCNPISALAKAKKQLAILDKQEHVEIIVPVIF